MNVSCGKGHSWADWSDTGHCASCHRTFIGLNAFDRHQSIKDDKTVCADPATKRWFDSKEVNGVLYYFKKAH